MHLSARSRVSMSFEMNPHRVALFSTGWNAKPAQITAIKQNTAPHVRRLAKRWGGEHAVSSDDRREVQLVAFIRKRSQDRVEEGFMSHR